MRHGSSQSGSVLIVVLWASLGLVSVALLFGQSMLMSYRGTDNDLAGRQAEQAIEGAARYVETLLLNADTPGLFPDPATYQAEAQPVGDATFWILGRPADNSGNGTVRTFGLVDEASKLNLNTATLEMLSALPGMTDELAASIIDWRDADEDVTDNGAESSVYLVLQPAYNCKNAPFESIEELALVHGSSRDILFGEDANLNGVLDPNEDDNNRTPPEDNGDGKLDPGIYEYVTVYSREPNTRSDGTARANVRTLTPEAQTVLSDALGASRAGEIAARFPPPVVGAPPVTVNSVLEFYVRSGMTSDEFALVSGSLTTGQGDYLPGLVNVNTASEAVLACIPGIGTDKASSLVAARLTRAQQDTNIAWVVDTLGEEGAIAAGPYLTGQSWQVSADVAAVGRHGRGYRRMKMIVDQSTGTPRIIYRKNLAPLGWALGRDIRLQLAEQKDTR